MQASEALHAFQGFLAAAGLSLDSLTPDQAVGSMVQFYREVRADDVDMDDDGDALLFQWGVYDWGEGVFFDYNITRQLIYADTALPDPAADGEEAWGEKEEVGDEDLEADGDDIIFGQLSLTLKFAPTDSLRAIADGNKWCQGLAELPAFIAFIAQNEATKAVQQAQVLKRELYFGNAE